MTITREDYFGRVWHIATPSEDVESNARELLLRVNALLAAVGFKTAVNSGWRPAAYNATVPGAAMFSKHITGCAIDLADPEGELDNLLYEDQRFLIEHQLWMENPLATKGWCHLQSIPPKSGRRVFIP